LINLSFSDQESDSANHSDSFLDDAKDADIVDEEEVLKGEQM